MIQDMKSLKLSDDQIATIITRACEFVEPDARPALVAHLYEMAYTYNENGSSVLFAHVFEKFFRKLMAAAVAS